MNIKDLFSDGGDKRIDRLTLEMKGDGIPHATAYMQAMVIQLVTVVDKELASRDDRLRKQASRIRALERSLGIAEGDSQ